MISRKNIVRDVSLCDRAHSLWELAKESREQAKLSVDCPNANGLIHPLVMSNPCLKGALFGPPNRVTLTLKKTDVWERRVHEVMPDGQRRLDAKPVGQVTFLAEAFAGTAQPEATVYHDSGEVTLTLAREGARCELSWLMTMSRQNVMALQAASSQGLAGMGLRLYRHLDDHGLPQPTSGHDGRHFWIRQAIPAEKTFPKGFEYYLVGLVAEGNAAIEAVEDANGLAVPIAYHTAGDRHSLLTSNEQVLMSNENHAPGAAATARLKRGDVATVFVTVVTNNESADPLGEAIRRLDAAAARGYAALKEENRLWYRELYERREQGRIFSGDDRHTRRLIPFLFRSWTSRHKLATDPDPARFEEDAYCYNLLNVDRCRFYGLNAYNEEYYTPESVANRSDRRMYYLRLVKHWANAWRERAREVYGAPGLTIAANGYYPPILADTDTHPNDDKADAAAVSPYIYADNLYVMKNVWDVFDYGGDEALLAEIYPYLRDLADFFAHVVQREGDGRYHINPAVFRECVAEQCKDATDCLASAKWSFRVAHEAAEILGTDSERASVWQDRLQHLAPYPVMEDPAYGPMLADGINAQGHPFQGMGKELVVSLADDITLDSPDAEKALVLNVLRSLEDRPAELWGGQVLHGQLWHLLGRGRDVSYTVNGARPILWRFQVDAWLVHYGSIQWPGFALTTRKHKLDACWYEPERLLNSRSGVLHFFPLVPTGTDVAFRGLQARGGFRVDAEYRSGDARDIRIHARRTRPCVFANPWPGETVEVRTGEDVAVQVSTEGARLTFPARAGETYRLSRDCVPR